MYSGVVSPSLMVVWEIIVFDELVTLVAGIGGESWVFFPKMES